MWCNLWSPPASTDLSLRRTSCESFWTYYTQININTNMCPWPGSQRSSVQVSLCKMENKGHLLKLELNIGIGLDGDSTFLYPGRNNKHLKLQGFRHSSLYLRWRGGDCFRLQMLGSLFGQKHGQNNELSSSYQQNTELDPLLALVCGGQWCLLGCGHLKNLIQKAKNTIF